MIRRYWVRVSGITPNDRKTISSLVEIDLSWESIQNKVKNVVEHNEWYIRGDFQPNYNTIGIKVADDL